MLADALAGESPAGGGRPGTAVVISSGREGDQPVGSLEVKALVGQGTKGLLPGSLKDSGSSTLGNLVRSAKGGQQDGRPQRTRNDSPETTPLPEADGEDFGKRKRERCRALPDWAKAIAVGEEWTGQEQPTEPRGLRVRHVEKEQPAKARNLLLADWPQGTAKAPRITGNTGKSRRAGKRGGWGRLSVDGPGQYNPDRSEGPWGRATSVARTAVLDRASGSDLERDSHLRQSRARRTDANQGDAMIRRLMGRPRLKGQPWSRTGENPPYGILGGTLETSA